MRFESVFNVKDRAWLMKENKPVEVIISAIEIFFVETSQDRISYNAWYASDSVSWLDHQKIQEADLYKSKTELLNSL